MAKILVIMAAGMGSRFGGDKQVAEIGPGGQILLEYSVYDALRAGFNRIVFVIRPGMEDFFNELIERMRRAFADIEFYFSLQGDKNSFDGIALPLGRIKPLGTVHAVLCAREYLKDPFAVINADDYYGPGAYSELIRAMDGIDDAEDAALISYALKNTLSSHGPVTRGICRIENGRLLGVRESYKVKAEQSGKIYESTGQGPVPLSPNTPVSMNMWAFSPKSLAYIEDYLSVFLDGLEADDNESECLLPVMADDLIKEGRLRILVYPTDERWFGLTYREDASDAAWELDKRHQDGHYPDVLF